MTIPWYFVTEKGVEENTEAKELLETLKEIDPNYKTIYTERKNRDKHAES